MSMWNSSYGVSATKDMMLQTLRRMEGTQDIIDRITEKETQVGAKRPIYI